ncbi:MAG: heat-inducible transcription repressor HrcA [Chloroflexi bacterium]|nr:heat-inducible transcription repressor HrcA [Chloroflexota bacterium]
MLTPRRGSILNLLISEYIATASPVGSKGLASRADLRLSPATLRNEMAELEDGGYIVRRHISGGGIPSSKGYRHFVASMPAEPALPADDVERVRREMLQAQEDVELWTNLAAELLAGLVGNLAVVTTPRAPQSRVKRLELVMLQETLALLVLILQQAQTKQRLVHLAAAASPEDLRLTANKLNALYAGASSSDLPGSDAEHTPLERQVIDAARDVLAVEDTGGLEEPQVTGLRHLLNQPEFANSSKAGALVDVLEDRRALKGMLPRMLGAEHTRVLIGDENEPGEMQECSVVIARYGDPDKATGIIAVIGPTRLEYQRSIAAVRHLSKAMTGLVSAVS